jgi:hypothetical protein
LKENKKRGKVEKESWKKNEKCKKNRKKKVKKRE